MDAAPFRALRYDPEVVGALTAATAPAYDEFSRFAYAQHRTANPYTVLQLLAPEEPAGAAAAQFGAAAAAYQRLQRTGVLVQDRRPGFHVYELHELRAGVPVRMRGLLAAVATGPPASSRIAVHEDVDPARVAARVARLRAVPVDLAPVFVVAPELPAILTALLDRPPDAPPVAALTDEEGVDHRVWSRTDIQEVRRIRTALADVTGVIADGHHRWAAAQQLDRELGRRRGSAAKDAEGDAPARTLVYLVDASSDGPQVLAVHRLLPRVPPDAARRLAPLFSTAPAGRDVGDLQRAMTAASARASSDDAIVLGLLLPNGGLLLQARDPMSLRARLPAGHSAAWRRLDAAVVEHVVLELLGVPAAEAAARADVETAGEQVAGGRSAALLLLRPPSSSTIARVALSGDRMPAKSTHFRPKPRTGLLMRALAPASAAGSTPTLPC